MSGTPVISLRPTCAADSRLLWEWANDPETRAASFHSRPIEWEEHERWFARKLDDPGCFIFVAQDGDGAPLGVVRFEVEGGEAQISVNLAPDRRRCGCGAPLIRAGVERFFKFSSVAVVHAFIKPTNPASLRVFEKAGFHPGGDTAIGGAPARHYVYHRVNEWSCRAV